MEARVSGDRDCTALDLVSRSQSFAMERAGREDCAVDDAAVMAAVEEEEGELPSDTRSGSGGAELERTLRNPSPTLKGSRDRRCARATTAAAVADVFCVVVVCVVLLVVVVESNVYTLSLFRTGGESPETLVTVLLSSSSFSESTLEEELPLSNSLSSSLSLSPSSSSSSTRNCFPSIYIVVVVATLLRSHDLLLLLLETIGTAAIQRIGESLMVMFTTLWGWVECSRSNTQSWPP